jgi:hypothetical protein
MGADQLTGIPGVLSRMDPSWVKLVHTSTRPFRIRLGTVQRNTASRLAHSPVTFRRRP